MKNERSIKENIALLTKKINHYNKLYYEGKPEISDYEFDQLLEKLQTLENKYPHLIESDSPTKKVGEHTSDKFKTEKHYHPMLSLSNSYSREEIQKFIERIEKALPNEKLSYFCELKFDGTAISIIYKNYVLQRVVTRGDGVQGDNITQNALLLSNIPKSISKNSFYSSEIVEVRAEMFMEKKVFEKLNKEKKIKNEKLFANPRNAAAGTLKLLNLDELKRRSLSYYAYTLILDNDEIKTQEEGIKILEKENFNISSTYRRCDNIDEILKYINYWEHRKSSLQVGIDGIVIKINNLEQQKIVGATSKSPRWAIAYKYKSENVSTTLLSVDFQIGRVGTITPVANLEPALISGTVVKRASLHNFKEIQRLDVKIGDKVFVEKGGEIIPKITGVDKKSREFRKVENIKFIKNCPDCSTILITDEKHTNYYCPNYKNCPTQIKGRIIHFASRDAMNIKELGSKTIELLYEHKLIHNIADIYDLSYNDISKLERFGDLSTKNLLKGIESSKNIPYHKLIYSLGIRHVGKNISKILTNEFQTIDELKNATVEQINNINEIGHIIAKTVNDFFLDSENLSLLEKLKHKGLIFEKKIEIKKKNYKLQDKKLVISGKFDNFEREKLKTLIEENGGHIISGISKNIDFLVIGDNPGPEKLKKAKKFNIKIISENEFLKLIKK